MDFYERMIRIEERAKIKRDSLSSKKKELAKLEQDEIDAEAARNIINFVAKEIQEGVSFKITSLVTNALYYVIENPYEFKMAWEVKANRSVCKLYLERDGFEANPNKDVGGTVNDLISATLRIAIWSLGGDNRSSPVFVLDEPGKFVSADYRERFSRFLKSICDKMGVQMIISTHSDDLIEGSDNIIRVYHDGKNSRIRRVA